MCTKNSKEKGFTLLEMVIVLIVVGLIATPFIQQYRTFTQGKAIVDTQESFYNVEAALQEYYEINGHLPCPAETYVVISTDASGNDLYDGASSTDNVFLDDFGTQNCDAFEDEIDEVDQTVLMGSIPTRTLGLNAGQALDGWNNKSTYVVSKYMVNIGAYDIEQDPPALSSLASRTTTPINFNANSPIGAPTCNNTAGEWNTYQIYQLGERIF